MEVANNPVEGTGEALDSAATFKQLLDSENATTDETDVASDTTDEVVIENTSDDEDIDGVEQPETDSEDDVDAETEDAGDEVAEVVPVNLKDEDIVDVNGEKITFKELRDRGLRQAQFTKKMQEVSELRKQFVQTQVPIAELRAEVSQVFNPWFDKAVKLFVDLNEKPPFDFEAEWDKNPDEAMKMKFAFERDMREKARVLKEAADYKASVSEQETKLQKEQDYQARISTRQSLQTLLPEQFGNDQAAEENLALITDFLRDFGYDDDTIGGIRDAKAIAIAYHAMMNIRTAHKKAEVVKKVNATVPRIPTKTTASKTTKSSSFDQTLRDVKAGRAGSQSLFKHLLENE